MPEFVACPACGFRVQTVESLLGKSVRCASCRHRFVLKDPEAPENSPERIPWPALPARPPDPEPLPPPGLKPAPPDVSSGGRMPLCPGCGREVPWNVSACPRCGLELEGQGVVRERDLCKGPMFRRDCEPHRGDVLLALGNLCLAVGALSLCTCGTLAVVTLPLGLVVWVMARNDLERMDRGIVDPNGRRETENARTAAVVGIVLSVFFGFFFTLMVLSRLGL